MKNLIYLLLTPLILLGAAPLAQANGRQPCDRGAGGISHCSGSKFVCNNGTISRSKRLCSASEYGTKKSGAKTSKRR